MMNIDDLILPQQNKNIMPSMAMPVEEDDEEPVPVVDEDDEHEHICPICTHNAGDKSVISKMNELEERLTGTISPEEIYRIMYQLWCHQVKAPLERQGMAVPEVTIEDIRTHYSHHRLNMRNIVSKEILFVNEMQKQLRQRQIAVRNKVTGQKRLILKGITEWQKLSKHKLELIKYYNNTLSKQSKNSSKGASIKPYEFS